MFGREKAEPHLGAKVELSDLVAYVSTQLTKASDDAKGRGEPVMEFDGCTLEMSVAVTSEAQAGIKVYVVTLGGDISKAETQTITATFKSIPGQEVVAETGQGEGKTAYKYEGPKK